MLEDERCAGHAAPGREESPEQGAADGKGRVGHHGERPGRKSQISRIGPHDLDAVAEAFAQLRSSSRMQLDGNDPHADVDECSGDRSVTRADVEYERARSQLGLSDEPARPRRAEFVPSPRPSRPGHGDAPSTSS